MKHAVTRRLLLGDQHGIALVAVLWVVTLLALVAAVFMRETRTELALTRNLENEAKAEALAEAGINRAILVLLGLDTSVPWRLDGTPIELVSTGGVIRISMQDESGKIDLNRSSDAVLQSLFVTAGLSADAAHRLTDAVTDFRDADNLRQVNGAEDSEYAAARLSHDAKDAPFASTEELLQVYGMTAEVYQRIQPLITVHSPRRDVNAATAPAQVLRSLPNLSPDEVANILAQRMADRASQPFRVPATTVVADATTANGARFIREAVLRRSPIAGQPFNIVKWSRRWPTESPPEQH